MSLVFNDQDTYKGLVQVYEDECGYDRGDVSGSIELLKDFTRDANLALDEFLRIALGAGGTWQFDDSNHPDYPIITTNLVSGQRDYTLSTDQNGNLVLEVAKVFVKDVTGVYQEIMPVDVNSGSDTPSFVPASGQLYTYGISSFTDGRNTTGTPSRYDKLATGIFLDPIPNYDSADGLKVYISREGSYFGYTDTTKMPGVPGIFHRYFAIRPALEYARRKQESTTSDLAAEVLKYEGTPAQPGLIASYFAKRTKDERPPGMRAAYQNNR